MSRVSRYVMVFVGGAGLAWSAEHGRKVQAGEWTGWIVDSSCRGSNANAQGKGCVLACARKGASLLLFTDASRPLFGLDDQKLALQHVGYRVKISGDQDGAYIKIKKIEAAAEEKAAPLH